MSDKEASFLPTSFAMYSDYYIPNKPLNYEAIARIYEKEVLAATKQYSYMGIWQLFSLASILNLKIQSVYHEKRNPHVRKDLNREILPRNHSKNLQEVHIMWTSTKNPHLDNEYWVPNHFTPMITIDGSQKEKGFLKEKKERNDKNSDFLNQETKEIGMLHLFCSSF